MVVTFSYCQSQNAGACILACYQIAKQQLKMATAARASIAASPAGVEHSARMSCAVIFVNAFPALYTWVSSEISEPDVCHTTPITLLK